jgi:predicted ATPase/class 3 adenylate cyclase
MPPVPTGTVTFLFTDIEGSTRLWERQPGTMRSALARHDALVRTVIAAHGGHVFKTIGDAFCAAFSRADPALAATLAAHRALHAEDWGALGTIRVRMACHTGSADERDGDYFGPTVNRVARLLAAGHGGQTLVSRATWEELGGRAPEGARARDLGERRLKDLTRPEHVYEVVPAELPRDFPALRTLDARPNNLPAQATALVGRERLLDAARAMLRDPAVRLVTLSGAGGAGKTRLALQLAADVVDEYEDGAWFVALAPIRDADLVASTILDTLGLADARNATPLQVIEGHLRERETLLVLDNFEQVTGAAPLVAALLAAATRLKVLVTSRTLLRVSGERDFAVPPLAPPEATRLFADRARALKADFRVTDENAPAIADICMHLDGLPLAIELAAARVRLLSPKALHARLTQASLDVLTGGARDLPLRQQTMRATIAWSYDLLDDDDKRLFRRFGVFARGAALEAVEAIAGATLDRVESLVDKSLLVYEDTGDAARFSMLETLREFAVAELEKSGEAERLRAEHAAWYVARAEEASSDPARQRHWLGWLDTEHDNLRGALVWALQDGNADLALRLSGALAWMWRLRGQGLEGRRALDDALALPGGASGPRARALLGAALLRRDFGDLREGRVFVEQALAMQRSLGDDRGIADTLYGLVEVAIFQGDFAAGRAAADEWGTLATKLCSKRDMAVSRVYSAWLDYEEGRGEAERKAAEALALVREVADEVNEANANCVLGEMVRARGDHRGALELYEAGLEIARALDLRRLILILAGNVGITLACLGEFERARPVLLEVVLAAHEIRASRPAQFALLSVARLAVAYGQPATAARLVGATDGLLEAEGGTHVFADRIEHDAIIALIEEASVTSAAERRAGREMNPEQAVELALDFLRRPR